MDRIGVDELKVLGETEGAHCLSLYLPTYRDGMRAKQNLIRFKELLRTARELLISEGFKGTQADQLLARCKELLHEESFWRQPGDGLALFVSSDVLRHYRLPLQFREEVMVGKRFLITPLLPLLNKDRKFYVLAVSEKKSRVLECSLSGFSELRIRNLPHNLQEAIRFNDPERQLQLHTQTPRIPGARAAAIFHGHGVGIDDEKDDLLEYCRQIDRALHSVLKNQNAPLIIASVEALFPVYRITNRYMHLCNEGIHGNPDLLSDNELHNRAVKILSGHFERENYEALKNYIELSGSSLVSSDIQQILSGAKRGRVQSLFVNINDRWWGRYDRDTGEVESHETYVTGDEEISNLAVVEAIAQGAKVYSIIPVLPEHPAIFAIFRF